MSTILMEEITCLSQRLGVKLIVSTCSSDRTDAQSSSLWDFTAVTCRPYRTRPPGVDTEKVKKYIYFCNALNTSSLFYPVLLFGLYV